MQASAYGREKEREREANREFKVGSLGEPLIESVSAGDRCVATSSLPPSLSLSPSPSPSNYIHAVRSFSFQHAIQPLQRTFQRASSIVCHTPSSDICDDDAMEVLFFGAIGLYIHVCRKPIVHHQYSTTKHRDLILSTTKSKPCPPRDTYYTYQCVYKQISNFAFQVTIKKQRKKEKNLPTPRYTNDVDGSKDDIRIRNTCNTSECD